MIIKETYTHPVSGEKFARIYSSKDFCIEKNNILYVEVISDLNTDLSGYTETFIPIPSKIVDASTFYQQIVGNNRKITIANFNNGLLKLKEILRNVSPEDAYRINFLYPEWTYNTEYITNDKVMYNNKMYVAISNSQGETTPDKDNAFEEVIPPQDIVEEWDNAYSKTYDIGDKVKIGSHIYVSLINNNTWSPIDFPAAWQLEEGSQV